MKEKQYSIIALNNQLYMVDKESKEKGNWEILEGHLNLISDDIEREGLLVIATTDNHPHIGLPLLPSIEEDIEILAREQFDINDEIQEKLNGFDTRKMPAKGREKLFQGYFFVFEQGYKAAKAKRFTEEDMRKAIEMARENDYYTNHYKARTISTEKYSTEQIIKSFTKVPIAVVVEMEAFRKPEKGKVYNMNPSKTFGENMNEMELVYELKVDENNFVNVLRWIYE